MRGVNSQVIWDIFISNNAIGERKEPIAALMPLATNSVLLFDAPLLFMLLQLFLQFYYFYNLIGNFEDTERMQATNNKP
jgi:hypothetical protein